jgi:hypothetical protein
MFIINAKDSISANIEKGTDLVFQEEPMSIIYPCKIKASLQGGRRSNLGFILGKCKIASLRSQ